jgi:IclR family KDG regulon transcriptional repressor
VVRTHGYAEDHEEFEDNMGCLAPNRDRFGHVTGTMSGSFPCFRFREELKQDFVNRLMETTQQISRQLSWRKT